MFFNEAQSTSLIGQTFIENFVASYDYTKESISFALNIHAHIGATIFDTNKPDEPTPTPPEPPTPTPAPEPPTPTPGPDPEPSPTPGPDPEPDPQQLYKGYNAI